MRHPADWLWSSVLALGLPDAEFRHVWRLFSLGYREKGAYIPGSTSLYMPPREDGKVARHIRDVIKAFGPDRVRLVEFAHLTREPARLLAALGADLKLPGLTVESRNIRAKAPDEPSLCDIHEEDPTRVSVNAFYDQEVAEMRELLARFGVLPISERWNATC